MPEFLGESAGAPERSKRLPKVTKADAAQRKPPDFPTRRERPEPGKKRDDEMARIAKDFRAGLARLGAATDQLSRQKLLEKITPRKLAELRKTAPSIARTLEREIRTITKLAKAAPDIKHTATVTRAFRERAERVVEEKLPQLYASILKAEQLVTKVEPAKVALPLKPGTPAAALVQAARAIRAGRLPFLPLETRKQAQGLIDRIFSRSRRSLETVRSPDGEQKRLIERHSLIPLAVRHDIMRDVWRRSPEAARALPPGALMPPKLLKTTDRQLLKTVNEVISDRVSRIEKETTIDRSAPVPRTVTTRNAPMLTQPVPAFQTQGVAAGGDYVAHTGESLHVISRDDRPLVEPHEETAASAPSVAPTPATRSRERAQTVHGVPVPSAPAAAAPAPRPPAARSAPAAGAAVAGESSVGGKGESLRIEGTLSIPGMDDWVAKIEGRTK